MAEMKFEDAIARLEKIVSELEDGELSLDEALKRYEDGVKLSAFCSKKLDVAEKKVKQLVKSEGGKFELKDFEAEDK